MSVLGKLKQKDYKVQGQPATEENPAEYREMEELRGGTGRRRGPWDMFLGTLSSLSLLPSFEVNSFALPCDTNQDIEPQVKVMGKGQWLMSRAKRNLFLEVYFIWNVVATTES